MMNSSCDCVEEKDGDTGNLSIVVGAVGSVVIGGLVGISSTLLVVVRFKKKKDAAKYLPRGLYIISINFLYIVFIIQLKVVLVRMKDIQQLVM